MLAAATPEAWLERAVRDWPLLLLDHASCEKKAASSALALIFSYPEHEVQNLALARLAREELRHFEQVTRLMRKLRVPFRRQQPGRYASGLRAAMRTHEPARRLDTLLIAALIEARSCERFGLLAPRLAPPLADFYAELQRVESRHGELYLSMAEAEGGDWRSRLAQLAAVEAGLISSPDGQFRFHSGAPRDNDASS